jgi:8-amino-7-oxononanoate synthase
MTVWSDRIERRNNGLRAAGRWRSIRALDGPGPEFVLPDGRWVISFASNDYLGLSHHPAVRRAAIEAIHQFGTGSGASRLVVGDRPAHRELERALADWKQAESAVLFATGFAANLGVLGAFGAPDALILSDERNHASIVDGCRQARAETIVYPHGDVDYVDKALTDSGRRPALIVTDAVFSMDGDLAPLESLAAVALEHAALLVVDEAHAVLGPHWSPSVGVEVLRVGTLSKTLGSLGGFVAGSRSLVEHLINVARPLIFTTAPTPADAAAALAALGVLRSPEGDALTTRLATLVSRLAPDHPSPILPVVVGDEERALEAATRLLDEHQLLVPAIRPPSVPPGTSRLRITLSAEHTDDQIERLESGLDALGLAPCSS